MDIYELLESSFLKEQDKIKKTIKYRENIDVKLYLPLREKFAFVFEAVEKASENNGYVSRVKAEIVFIVLIMKYYTNITFDDLTDEEIYDICIVNNLASDIIKLIPKAEYEDLLNMLIETVKEINTANSSIVGAISTINELMGKGIQKMNEEVQSLDAEQIDKVIELAKTTGFK